MAARVKQRVLVLRVANLAQAHLLVGNLPIADALAVPLAVPVPAHVLVARLALDERALPVPLVRVPVAFVRVARRVLHLAFALPEPEDKGPRVGGARVGDVRAVPVPVTVLERAGVVVAAIAGFYRLCSCESARRVVAGEGPVIEYEVLGVGEEPFFSEFLFPARTNVSISFKNNSKKKITHSSAFKFFPTTKQRPSL